MVDYFLSVLNGLGGSWVLGRRGGVIPNYHFEFVANGGHSVVIYHGDSWPDGKFEVWSRGGTGISFDIGDHEQVVKSVGYVLRHMGVIDG